MTALLFSAFGSTIKWRGHRYSLKNPLELSEYNLSVAADSAATQGRLKAAAQQREDSVAKDRSPKKEAKKPKKKK
jgi:hypothetical protein